MAGGVREREKEEGKEEEEEGRNVTSSGNRNVHFHGIFEPRTIFRIIVSCIVGVQIVIIILVFLAGLSLTTHRYILNP